MHVPPGDLSATQQWMLIAEWLFGASLSLSVVVVLCTYADRWVVSRRGLAGVAIVEEIELIQTLPRKIWEVRLNIVPDDRTTVSFHRRARWSQSDFYAHCEELAPGAQLPVRFRRAPRPLVMPSRS